MRGVVEGLRKGGAVGAVVLAVAGATALLGATARPAAAAVQAGITEVPLEVGAAGRLIVPVETADGRTLRFALHTAIPTAMVAASVAGDDPAALGLHLAGTDVALTAVEAIPDEALVVDGQRVDGFVLTSALGDVDLLIDAPGGRFALKPIGRAVEWPGTTLSAPATLRVYHGVALRLEIEVEGRPYGATLDLATPRNVVNAGVVHDAGVRPDAPATVTFGGVDRSLTFAVEQTPVLARWDPDAAGFVSFGAALATDCALSISYVHQELRTCVR